MKKIWQGTIDHSERVQITAPTASLEIITPKRTRKSAVPHRSPDHHSTTPASAKSPWRKPHNGKSQDHLPHEIEGLAKWLIDDYGKFLERKTEDENWANSWVAWNWNAPVCKRTTLSVEDAYYQPGDELPIELEDRFQKGLKRPYVPVEKTPSLQHRLKLKRHRAAGRNYKHAKAARRRNSKAS